MKKTLLLSLVLLLIGAGCAGSAVPAQKAPAAPVQPVTTLPNGMPLPPQQTEPQKPEVNDMIVTHEQKAGGDILIARALLDQPGFVSISASENGKQGKILGASSLLTKGEHTNFTIPVKIADKQSYWAVLRTDNGNGTFNEAEDKVTTDSNGIMILSRIDGPGAVVPVFPSATTTSSTPPVPGKLPFPLPPKK